MQTIQVRYTRKRIVRERLRLALVKHDPNRTGFPQLTYFPDVIRMQNYGYGEQKGDRFSVKANWWRYIEKINNEDGFRYARSVDLMWINVDGDGAYRPDDRYTTGRAEPVVCGGGIIAITGETATHYKVLTYPNEQNTDLLDPRIDNWFFRPYRFWKAVAILRNGTEIINPGRAWDVYIPILQPAIEEPEPSEFWIQKSRVVPLEGGREMDWEFHGDGNVWLNGVIHTRSHVVPPKTYPVY